MTTIYNRQYGLQADSLGFLVSQNRLERATRDMPNTHKDAKALIPTCIYAQDDNNDNDDAESAV
jgi:hypothetical protein